MDIYAFDLDIEEKRLLTAKDIPGADMDYESPNEYLAMKAGQADTSLREFFWFTLPSDLLDENGELDFEKIEIKLIHE